MIKRIVGRDISIKVDTSSYDKTMARFNEILNEKINFGNSPKIKPSTMHYHSKIKADRNNLRLQTSSSAADINRALEGTGLSGLGEQIKKAEHRYGVNAWFLTALAAHESGFGTSKIAMDKNNLFGFMAYDSSPYRSAMSFKNRGEGINHVANYISNQYLKVGGAHFSGITIDSVGKSYATDKKWADKISLIMNNLIKKSEN